MASYSRKAQNRPHCQKTVIKLTHNSAKIFRQQIISKFSVVQKMKERTNLIKALKITITHHPIK